jgi:hypothetical protein
LGESKFTTDEWVGCVAKPFPTWDRTHHLQHIKWDNFVASLETGTPSHSFPLAVSLLLALVGGSSQSRIIESKICGQTPIIL